jgi:hypothetical protein
MALIPVGAVDYKTALVAARITFSSTTAGTVTGDRRGFVNAVTASATVDATLGTITVTLASELLTNLSDAIVTGCHLKATADTVAGLMRVLPIAINTTTGAITLRAVKEDGTSGVGAYAAIAASDILHLSVLLVYNQE